MLKMPTLDVQSSPVDVRAATKVAAQDVNVFYGAKQALQNVSVNIPDRAV
ncbi:MAG: phosphate ABC transporter ATP-binding protein, partial [Hyphomicrobium sp.]|nr:phosphate ABC transporter ATP-binding protein [Hyphomicrobium sp.]